MAKARFSPLASTLRRAAACCTVGAAITLAIAWWSAWQTDLGRAELDTTWDGQANVRILELCSAMASRRSWDDGDSMGPVDDLRLAWNSNWFESKAGSTFRLSLGRWPRWGKAPFGIPWSVPLPKARLEDARGWPFRALWCEVSKGEQGKYSVTGGIELPPSAPPDALTYRALPLRPIWPGLAADTAVFAVPLFVLWSFARLARAHRRLSRGRCPRCAYDLRFDLRAGCPECGWNRATPQPPAAEAPT